MPKKDKDASTTDAAKPKKAGPWNPSHETRFKPGVCPNLKGRGAAKRTSSLREIYLNVFTELVSVREGTKTRKITRLEALLRKQVELAFRGNHRAIQSFLLMAKELGLMKRFNFDHFDLTQLTDKELDIFEKLLKGPKLNSA